jgi:hypothetical protein
LPSIRLALGSWLESPVLKVNASWLLFVFFLNFFYLNVIIQTCFHAFFIIRLSQSYTHDYEVFEFTWFNKVFSCFFFNIVLQFHPSLFGCLIIRLDLGLVLFTFFHHLFIYCSYIFFVLFKLPIKLMTWVSYLLP